MDKKRVSHVDELHIGTVILDKPAALIQQEGEIRVTRTLLKKPTTTVEKIKIRPFVTAPASVGFNLGFWMPTGDMRGAKAEVQITMPCYKEEVMAMFNQVREMADELVEAEYERLGGNGKKD